MAKTSRFHEPHEKLLQQFYGLLRVAEMCTEQAQSARS